MAIWTEETDDKRLEYVKKGYTSKDIAKLLNETFNTNKFNRRMIDKRNSKLKQTRKDLGVTVRRNLELHNSCNCSAPIYCEELEDFIPTNNNDFYEEYFDDFNKENFIHPYVENISDYDGIAPYNEYGIADKFKVLKKIYNKYTNSVETVLFLSDFHCPEVDLTFLQNVLKRESKNNVDLIILGGDVFDCDSISKFADRNSATLEREQKSAESVFYMIRKYFPSTSIMYILGNHEKRVERTIFKMDKINADFLISTGIPFLDRLCNKYNIDFVYLNIIQIGDVIFTHGSNYSKIQLQSAVRDFKHFVAEKKILPNSSFKALIMGHTHHAANFSAATDTHDVFIAEAGCMCHTNVNYKFEGKSDSVWKNAYGIIKFNKGKFLVNESRVYMGTDEECDDVRDYLD
jgi:predicted phosphodiesterase